MVARTVFHADDWYDSENDCGCIVTIMKIFFATNNLGLISLPSGLSPDLRPTQRLPEMSIAISRPGPSVCGSARSNAVPVYTNCAVKGFAATCSASVVEKPRNSSSQAVLRSRPLNAAAKTGVITTSRKASSPCWQRCECLLANFLQDFVENLKRPAHFAHVALTMSVRMHRLALA